jgi:hypothetical protein
LSPTLSGGAIFTQSARLPMSRRIKDGRLSQIVGAYIMKPSRRPQKPPIK